MILLTSSHPASDIRFDDFGLDGLMNVFSLSLEQERSHPNGTSPESGQERISLVRSP